ncbi:NACHT domain-containing protein [Dactylosporangium sp. NPDC049140]|uniref:NACHT domain-containing protein n=1 Tax=Dactylosporangium sp. NPDC049140 TaxID=3155647 RepID=UPI0034086F0A
MVRFGRVLRWAVATVAVPAVVVVPAVKDWALRHPLLAVAGALAWEAGVLLVAGLERVTRAARESWVRQISDAFERWSGQRLSRYEQRYRRYVLSRVRFVDGKGLATAGDFTLELDQVYVDVGLTPRPLHQVGTGVVGSPPDDTERRMAIQELLQQSYGSVLAVVGGPGSGKTTLLHFVARGTARAQHLPRPVPVFLELRDVGGRLEARPTLPELLEQVMADLVGPAPAGWWEAQLRRGRCVVLLDGLDEVATDKVRGAAGRWIEDQLAAYPDNDFVITSRPQGYENAQVTGARLLHVRPLTREQVRRFLQQWYRAAIRAATFSATEPVTADEIERLATADAVDLLARLAGNPALYQLTANPLLLTMMCNVHRYRGALPGSRADLYSEICQVMLWRRQEARRQAVMLTGPAKLRLLAAVAFAMMDRRVAYLHRDRVTAVLRDAHRRGKGSVGPAELLADFTANGLLVERERDEFAFAHLTFQEYLAARYLRDQNRLQVAVDSVADPWWREVIVFSVADGNADEVVRACLDHNTVPSLTLAFDCAATDADLSEELRDELEAVVDRAFRDKAGPAEQRLVAGVLIGRHLGTTAQIPSGTMFCLAPVPTSIWWLYCREAEVSAPDAPCPADGRRPEPVRGVHGVDILKLPEWLDEIVATGGGLGYRLPDETELREFFRQQAELGTPAPVASAWALPASPRDVPRLVTNPAVAVPRFTLREEIVAGVVADVARWCADGIWLTSGLRAFGDARRSALWTSKGGSRLRDADDARRGFLRFVHEHIDGPVRLTREDSRLLDQDRDLDLALAVTHRHISGIARETVRRVALTDEDLTADVDDDTDDFIDDRGLIGPVMDPSLAGDPQRFREELRARTATHTDRADLRVDLDLALAPEQAPARPEGSQLFAAIGAVLAERLVARLEKPSPGVHWEKDLIESLVRLVGDIEEGRPSPPDSEAVVELIRRAAAGVAAECALSLAEARLASALSSSTMLLSRPIGPESAALGEIRLAALLLAGAALEEGRKFVAGELHSVALGAMLIRLRQDVPEFLEGVFVVRA